MSKIAVHSNEAPKAIGTYSQAIRCGQTVYFSAQAPLDPETMEVAGGGVENEVGQVFNNLQAVAREAGGELADIVKLTVYLTDLAIFPVVNQAMERLFPQPYPARAVVGATALPRATRVAIDAVMVVPA